MERQVRRDTKPELALRGAVWRLGLRYRVDVAPIPGRRRADLVFTRAKVAVYVDGCFWHSCPSACTVPKANRDWWVAKLQANVARDRDTDARLAAQGLGRRSGLGARGRGHRRRDDRGDGRATSSRGGKPTMMRTYALT